MFGKNWRNSVLIEGEKEAMLIARMEGFPAVNPEFDSYPVDVTLKKKQSFWGAVKRAVLFSERNIYNMIYKDGK